MSDNNESSQHGMEQGNEQPDEMEEDNSPNFSKEHQPQQVGGTKQESIVKRWLECRKRKRNHQEDNAKSILDMKECSNAQTCSPIEQQDPSALPTKEAQLSPLSWKNDTSNSLESVQENDSSPHRFDCDPSIRRDRPTEHQAASHSEEPHREHSNSNGALIQVHQEATPTDEALNSQHSDTANGCGATLPTVAKGTSPDLVKQKPPLLSSLPSPCTNNSPKTQSSLELSMKSSASPPAPGNFFYTQATQLSQESPPNQSRETNSILKRIKLAEETHGPTCDVASRTIPRGHGRTEVDQTNPPRNDDARQSPVPKQSLSWKPPALGGFCTAGGGSEVKVSTEQLQQVSNLFRQSPPRHSTSSKGIAAARSSLVTSGSTSESKHTLSGFRMAGSGKDLTVKTETLRRANSLFNDTAYASCSADNSTQAYDFSVGRATNDDTMSTTNNVRNPKVFTNGFCTAGSGTTVSVSEESMKRISSLFSNNDSIHEARRSHVPQILEHKVSDCVDIRKDVENHHTEENSMTCVKDSNSEMTVPTSTVSDSSSSFLGFRSAGKGTAVVIGEAQLQRAQHLLRDIDPCFVRRNSEMFAVSPSLGASIGTNDIGQTPSYKRKPELCSGFATAGKGFQMIGSREILQREVDKANWQPNIQELDCRNDAFSVLVDRFGCETSKKQSEPNSCPDDSKAELPTSFVGFKTAGQGNHVTIGNTTLGKLKYLFEDGNVDKGIDTHPREQHAPDNWPHESKVADHLRSSIQTPGAITNRPNYETVARVGADGIGVSSESCPKPLVTPGTRHKTAVSEGPPEDSDAMFPSNENEPRRSSDSTAESCEVVPTDILVSTTPSQTSRNKFVTPGGSNIKSLNPAFTTPGNIGCERRNGLSLTHSKPSYTNYDIASLSDAYEHGRFTKIEDCVSFGISDCLLRVSSDNALSLRFCSSTGLPCGFYEDVDSRNDADWIGAPCDYLQVMGEQRPGKAMDISERWVKNHLRWIIWKLASMERRFAAHLCGCLTFSSVVRQLNLRFDREFLDGIRSPIRKIANRDVSAASMMILCVARIIRQEPNSSNRRNLYGLEMTDGWYSLRTEIDASLSSYIDRGLISIGTKLAVSNASLTGYNEGSDHMDEAFDVMDPDRSPYLSIRGNGCRIARWNARLGFVSPQKFQNQSGLLCVKKIRDVLVDGGPVPEIEVSVVNCDPVKYLARTEGGYKVWTEIEAAARMEETEKAREKLVDQFRQEVEKECEDEVDENSPKLWVEMHAANDPDSFFHELSLQDRTEILNWREKRSASIQRRLQEEMEARLEDTDFSISETTPFIRCVLRSVGLDGIDCDDRDSILDDEAVLTVWKPTEDHISMLRKGNCVCLRKVDVQPHLFNGRKQFQAQRETAIDFANGLDPIKINTDAPRVDFSSLLEVHMFGRSLMTATNQENSRPFCLIGYVIALQQTTDALILRFTDESHLLARIIVDSTDAHNSGSVRSLVEFASTAIARNSFAIIGFKNVIVREFEYLMQCPTIYGNSSNVMLHPEGKRAKRLQELLQRQDHIQALKQTASFSGLGIPKLSILRSGQILIGYISGFRLVASHQLQLTIDVGSELMRTALVPLVVLLEMQNTMETSFIDCHVAFVDDKGCVLDQLQSLRWLYRCRHTLFRFALKFESHPNSATEVTSMKPLDQGILSELYTMARKNRCSQTRLLRRFI